MSKQHETQREGYHFSTNGKLSRSGLKIIEGKTYFAQKGKHRAKTSEIYLCGPGLHASPLPHRAWNYVNGNTVSKVVVKGIPLYNGSDGGKFCGKTRTHVKVVKLNDKQRQYLDLATQFDQWGAIDSFIKGLVG